MRNTRVTIAAIAAVAALGLAACSNGDSGETATEDATEEVVEEEVEEPVTEETETVEALCANGESVKIGIKFDQPGLGFQEGSEYTGFDVDVAQYVADELGCGDIEWVSAPSAQRENMLQTGQVDMIFATYSITDTRREVVDFAGPYFVAGQDFLVRQDDSSITGPADLDGKNLCSVTGSTSAQKVKDEHPGVNLVEQPGYADCLGFLESGQVDAVTTDDIILAGLAATPANQGKFKVVGNPFSEELYGVGLPKGSTATCEVVNTAIASMVESGAWEQAVTSNTEGTGYTPNAEKNPPTVLACS